MRGAACWSIPIARVALSREPGFANYVLSYAAAFENDAKKAINLMTAAYMAHFVPAASALGLILSQGWGVSKHPKEAEIFFLRAVKAGHIPATLLLCRFYMQGKRGEVKRILNVTLFPFAWLYVWITTRFMIFSIRAFRHFNVNVPPTFNEKALKSSSQCRIASLDEATRPGSYSCRRSSRCWTVPLVLTNGQLVYRSTAIVCGS
jgi:hypothetical protein